MARGNTVVLTFAGDTKSLEGALRRASTESDKAAGRFKGLGKAAALGLAGMATAAAGLGAKMISMASDAEEVRSKFETVFGKQVPQLNKNIEAFSKATGASTFAMREQIANMGALLAPMLGSKKAAADMSLQFTKLATDLGSFNNVATDDALLALRSGLTGEAEPLRQFGILINDAAVKAEAYRSGIAKTGKELTEVQKVQARANLIMQQTTLAQGDATRTSGSFANQIKALKNQISDTATEIGVKLLPYALKIVKWVNETGIPAFKNFANAVGPVLGGAFKYIVRQIEIFRNDVRTFINDLKAIDAFISGLGPGKFPSIPSGPGVTGGRPGSFGGGGTPAKPAVPVKTPDYGGGGTFGTGGKNPARTNSEIRREASWTSASRRNTGRTSITRISDALRESLGFDPRDTTSPGSLAYAMAQLTESVADDYSALQTLVMEAEKAYTRSFARGPGAVVEAAGALQAARSNLAGLGPMQRLASGEIVPTLQGSAADLTTAALEDILRAKGQLPAVTVGTGAGVGGASVYNITINTAATSADVIAAIRQYEQRNGQTLARV